MSPSRPSSCCATTPPMTANSPERLPSSQLFNPSRRQATPRPTTPNRLPVKPGKMILPNEPRKLLKQKTPLIRANQRQCAANHHPIRLRNPVMCAV
jgi:hypothetical protein